MRDFWFLNGSAPLDSGDAQSFSLGMRRFSRVVADSGMTSRNMETTSRGLCSCSRNMRRINPAALRRRFRRALEVGQSAEKDAMFHVKQFLIHNSEF